MSAADTIRIDAAVDAVERPAVSGAAERLGACLGHATARHWPVEVRFVDCLAEITAPATPSVVIASMLPELPEIDEPYARTAVRLRDAIRSLPGEGAAAAFLLTIFRHVADAGVAIERIRRLNLLAAELSRETGVNIVDIDRAFAHVGARALQTDYQLGGTLAIGLAADTIVTTVLNAGCGGLLEPEALDKASAVHAERSAPTLGQALSVSAASLHFATARHERFHQTYSRTAPPLTPSTTRELLRDVRQGRTTVGAAAPLILGKVLRRMPWVSR